MQAKALFGIDASKAKIFSNDLKTSGRRIHRGYPEASTPKP
ncbi:hypothetical protein BIWAKO_05778 [Bosea sp. BIWAKO-01]|nr:hypothetical protein BIWAKO_05778 [Bosea sp. BIWAKO-01]